MFDNNISLEKCPALVLNADYRPLSYYPLSLWSWQDSIKSVFLNRVSIVSYYDRVVRSPSFSMKLPSVIALRDYIAVCERNLASLESQEVRDEEAIKTTQRDIRVSWKQLDRHLGIAG